MRRREGETGDEKSLRLFRKLLLAEVAPSFAPAPNRVAGGMETMSCGQHIEDTQFVLRRLHRPGPTLSENTAAASRRSIADRLVPSALQLGAA